MKPKIKCKNLREVRRNIDRIDERIVNLLLQRGRFAREALRFKRKISHVRAPGRESRIIRKVRLLARRNGFQPDIMENIYRGIIENFVSLEMEEFPGKTF